MGTSWDRPRGRPLVPLRRGAAEARRQWPWAVWGGMGPTCGVRVQRSGPGQVWRLVRRQRRPASRTEQAARKASNEPCRHAGSVFGSLEMGSSELKSPEGKGTGQTSLMLRGQNDTEKAGGQRVSLVFVVSTRGRTRHTVGAYFYTCGTEPTASLPPKATS